MAVLKGYELWVGAERRADGNPRHPEWFPQGYVTLEPRDGDTLKMSPDAARTVAKRLKEFADALDPPKPRKKRT